MTPGTTGEMDLFDLPERKCQQVKRAAVRIVDISPPSTGAGRDDLLGRDRGWLELRAGVAWPGPDEWTVAAVMPTPDLRGFSLRAGVSFITMLKEHARPEPDTDELLAD